MIRLPAITRPDRLPDEQEAPPGLTEPAGRRGKAVGACVAFAVSTSTLPIRSVR
jgi:hypothetical protein